MVMTGKEISDMTKKIDKEEPAVDKKSYVVKNQYELKVDFVWSNMIGKALVNNYFSGKAATKRLERNAKKDMEKYDCAIHTKIEPLETGTRWRLISNNMQVLEDTEKQLTTGLKEMLAAKLNRLRVGTLTRIASKFTTKKVSDDEVVRSISEKAQANLGFIMFFTYYKDGVKIVAK